MNLFDIPNPHGDKHNCVPLALTWATSLPYDEIKREVNFRGKKGVQAKCVRDFLGKRNFHIQSFANAKPINDELFVPKTHGVLLMDLDGDWHASYYRYPPNGVWVFDNCIEDEKELNRAKVEVIWHKPLPESV